MGRLYKAFFNSKDGIKIAFRDEAAFRQELLLAIVLVPAAFYLAPDKISLVLMLGSLMLVLIVELLNSGIEAAIDRIGAEIHPLSKKAKDVASAAVLFSLMNLAITWLVILV